MKRRSFLIAAGAVPFASSAGASPLPECIVTKPTFLQSNKLFSIRALAVATPAVLGMGDSRTSQLGWQFLGSQRFSFVNMGVGGGTVGAYRDFLYNDQVQEDIGKPVGALINLGINNVWDPPESAAWRDFEKNYRDIVDWCVARNMWVVACTPSPLEKGFPAMLAAERTPRVDEICQRIKAVAADAKIPVIDFNHGLRQEDHTAIAGTTIDGLHLSGTGQTAHWQLTNDFISRNIG